ncbi:hypothetical protein BgiMline_005545, partial [Biomphalaria glabrata]
MFGLERLGHERPPHQSYSLYVPFSDSPLCLCLPPFPWWTLVDKCINRGRRLIWRSSQPLDK